MLYDKTKNFSAESTPTLVKKQYLADSGNTVSNSKVSHMNGQYTRLAKNFAYPTIEKYCKNYRIRKTFFRTSQYLELFQHFVKVVRCAMYSIEQLFIIGIILVKNGCSLSNKLFPIAPGIKIVN